MLKRNRFGAVSEACVIFVIASVSLYLWHSCNNGYQLRLDIRGKFDAGGNRS